MTERFRNKLISEFGRLGDNINVDLYSDWEYAIEMKWEMAFAKSKREMRILKGKNWDILGQPIIRPFI